MFGYIAPDVPYLYVKDVMLYKAAYCGLCRSIGATCGSPARLGLSYDTTFLALLLHNLLGQDMRVQERRCALHCTEKRPIADRDDIFDAVALVNTAMTYYKCVDDVTDHSPKGALRILFQRGFQKVRRQRPDIAELVATMTNELHALEKADCAVPDAAAEPFAHMMDELCAALAPEVATPECRRLFYDIGKWVYLVDAVDDFEKDVKKKNYNVFAAAYPECKTRTELLTAAEREIDFIFQSLFQDMAECRAKLTFHFNSDLTDNVILRGLPLVTKTVLQGKKVAGMGKIGIK